MSKIRLINASCAEQDVDAVVNAANKYLLAGGGICGVIYRKAGYKELELACDKYETPLKDGDAVITPSFGMKNTTAIIHAIGPNFHEEEAKLEDLQKAYYNSLIVLKNNKLHSISFPLISSGIFGGNLPNPPGISTKQCINAYTVNNDAANIIIPIIINTIINNIFNIFITPIIFYHKKDFYDVS